jgi:hypothetical protein
MVLALNCLGGVECIPDNLAAQRQMKSGRAYPGAARRLWRARAGWMPYELTI